jgi:hypothetical protein
MMPLALVLLSAAFPPSSPWPSSSRSACTDAFETGLRLMPWGAAIFVAAPMAGSRISRVGERPFVVGGLLLGAAGDRLARPDRQTRPRLLPDGRAARHLWSRHVDDDPRGPERGHEPCRFAIHRQGIRHLHDVASAWRSVWGRDRSRGIRRRWRLPISAGLQRGVRSRARDLRRTLVGRCDHRSARTQPPPNPALAVASLSAGPAVEALAHRVQK